MKIKVAILDKDICYLNRIKTVFDTKYMDNIQSYSFTDEEVAYDTIKEARIDILLASDQFDLDIKKITNRCVLAYFVESSDVKEWKEYKAICKFQKVELIYKQILSLYAEKKIDVHNTTTQIIQGCSIYTFLSASGGVGSSTVAVAAAMNAARNGKKVFYLNLQLFGDTTLFLQGEGTGNLSEVLYAIKSKKTNLKLKVQSNIKSDKSGIEFYESCHVPFDLMEMTDTELESIVSEIAGLGIYNCIVIDSDFDLSKINMKLFSISNKIIFVNDGSEIGNLKFKKACTALTIFEEQRNENYISKIRIIYNKFRTRTSRALDEMNDMVIGGINFFDGADTKQILEQINYTEWLSRVFD